MHLYSPKMFFLHSVGCSTKVTFYPFYQVEKSFRSGNDVKRRRNCATIFKIRYPQFTAGKLPFCISSLLQHNHFKAKELWFQSPRATDVKNSLLQIKWDTPTIVIYPVFTYSKSDLLNQHRCRIFASWIQGTHTFGVLL